MERKKALKRISKYLRDKAKRRRGIDYKKCRWLSEKIDEVIKSSNIDTTVTIVIRGAYSNA